MKTLTTLTLMGVLAVSVPALADDSSTAPATTPSASQQCRTERTGMGTDLFRQTYGTNKNKRNAFGKCVSKTAKAQQQSDDQASS